MNRLSARLDPDHRFAARFTTAEFLHMDEAGAFDGMRVELVEGELERMDRPKSNHATRQASVMIRLGRLVAEHLLMGDVGIDLGDDTVLGCDVAMLRNPVSENRLLGADDVHLVVEIAETTRSRDMGMKRVRYATASIPHYWVVDGERSVVHVYGDPSDGDYSRVRTTDFGEPLDVPGTGQTIVID